MQGAWGMCEVSLREGPQRPFQTAPPPRGGGKEEGREMAQRADPSSGVQELLLTSWPESCQCVPSSQCGCWDIPGPEPCWYSTVKPRPSLIHFTTYDETVLIPTPHLRPFASSSNSQKKLSRQICTVVVAQLPSHVWLFATPWKAACQASLSRIDLLQDNMVKVFVAQSCLTLCDPMDCSPPSSSLYGILQARILAWTVILFSRVSSWPRGQTYVSCITGRFFTIWATR